MTGRAKLPCALCSRLTTHINPPNGDPQGQTRYHLCHDCGGVPPRTEAAQ